MRPPRARPLQWTAIPRIAGALALCAAAGCESVRVDYDYDPGASFERLSTFAWREHAESALGDAIESPLRDKAVREAVTAELEARGFRENAPVRTAALAPAPAPPSAPDRPVAEKAGAAPSAAADFVVSAVSVVRQRVNVSYPYGYYGSWGCHGWWHSPWWGNPWVYTWDEGTLVLDIADGRTGAPLWRGTATRALDDDVTPEERRDRLREAVREVLAKFPPPR